ncbi:MAG: hypothetical protein KDC61_15375 [Saprospiraceae bacterium]|nr:hypothetical protein [Saprospiraceae bacterium]
MPVHINEIVIRANLVEPTKEAKPSEGKPQKLGDVLNRDQLISEAVAQVLQILRMKKER